MRLIAVTGRKRSGKGAVSASIARQLLAEGSTCLEVGFSDLLKQQAYRLFVNPDGTIPAAVRWADKVKEGHTVTVAQPRPDLPANGVSVRAAKVSMRTFLQRLGTEAGRDMWGPDFWVAQMERRLNAVTADVVVIGDLRFDNEAEWVREVGGEVWEVQRPGLAATAESSHASESGIQPTLVDRVLVNGGSLEALDTLVGIHLFGVADQQDQESVRRVTA